MAIRERAVERYLKDAVLQAGGSSWKWVSPGHTGVPDRIVIFPGGRVYFVEVKTKGGKLSARQTFVLRLLRAFGCNTDVVYSRDDVDDFLKRSNAI